jgi:hypothetical protein
MSFSNFRLGESLKKLMAVGTPIDYDAMAALIVSPAFLDQLLN